MPTPAAALATFAGLIATATGGTRMASDHRVDLEGIALGATVFQLRGAASLVDERGSSNDVHTRLLMLLEVHHRLSGAERSYTEGAMQSAIVALTTPQYWRVAATTWHVSDNPALVLGDVRRVGKVISYTITVAVDLLP